VVALNITADSVFPQAGAANGGAYAAYNFMWLGNPGASKTVVNCQGCQFPGLSVSTMPSAAVFENADIINSNGALYFTQVSPVAASGTTTAAEQISNLQAGAVSATSIGVSALSATSTGATLPGTGAFTTLTSQPATPTADAGNVGTVLAQTSLPMIYASGTISNSTGGVTSLPTLPATYANAYLYLPIGAIYSGSTAGWYLFQGTTGSKTAGTVFNNIYSPSTGGTPTIQAPTPFMSGTTTPGPWLQTPGTYISAVAATVPANALGLNGELQVDFDLSVSNNTDTKQWEVVYGGVQVSTGNTATSGVAAVSCRYRTRNNGSASAQVSTSSASPCGVNTTGPTFIRTTVASTSSHSDVIALNLGTSTDYEVLEGFSIKLFTN